MTWIAIDAGTSVTKAVLFADNGRELAVARANTAVLRPRPAWREQDMDEVWRTVVAAVREVKEQRREEIRGIVSTAQGDGCWLVDEHARPTGNAVLWNDGRAGALVEAWRKEGVVERSFRLSGSVTYAGLPNAVLAWLRAHEPERLNRARWALTCNGWLFARMTGEIAAELSDASNPFSDVRQGAYASELLALYGADARLLPPVVQGAQSQARLNETAARELGLAAGLPAVMAPYDIVCTAYGAGASRAGQACVILGTTICPEVLTATLDLSGEPRGTTVGLAAGLHMRAMPTLTGCEALEWCAGMLGVQGISALGAISATATVAQTDPVFLPYLSPAGERSPFLAPEARGSFHGLELGTTRAALGRAVFEGLSFATRECLEAAASAAPVEVCVCGGGARSDLWCQMIADTLGAPVLRAAGSEHGARGAYLFALAVMGEVNSVSEGLRRHEVETRRFEPAQERLYDERFQMFKDVRDMAQRQWQTMMAVNQ